MERISERPLSAPPYRFGFNAAICLAGCRVPAGKPASQSADLRLFTLKEENSQQESYLTIPSLILDWLSFEPSIQSFSEPRERAERNKAIG